MNFGSASEVLRKCFGSHLHESDGSPMFLLVKRTFAKLLLQNAARITGSPAILSHCCASPPLFIRFRGLVIQEKPYASSRNNLMSPGEHLVDCIHDTNILRPVVMSADQTASIE